MRAFRPILSLTAFLLGMAAWATHNRAGEIIVCHVNGLTYQVTIVTHTKLSAPADRPELVLDWGDGTPLDTIARTLIADDPTRDLRRNEYVSLHTYAGPGTFFLQFDDQNRNGGVINVLNSIQVSFCVRTKLVISPATGHNCSVRFEQSPIQDACVNQPWIHNPAAYDLDGDSLSYEPAVCLGNDCLPIAGYTFPGPNYNIDPTTGTITWIAPTLTGEYNIAFIVREWRKVGNVWVEVGYVTRDMQITVRPCDNQPPQITPLQDTCVVAGTLLTFPVQASDPNAGQTVTLTALGQPFVVPSSPATFPPPTGGQNVTGLFTWNTNCSHVRVQPYQVVFTAIDNGQPVQLQDVKTMTIRIVAPPPLDPLATPSGSSMQLTWSPSVCGNATGYRIYRRSGFFGYVPGHCETGVPAYTGYSLIGTVQGVANSNFTDPGPLIFGNQYCYMVTATFADGGESIASEEFCAIPDGQVPLLTHVSVGVTDGLAGIDTVRWTNAYDLDTIARPGPYQFRLYRGTGLNVAEQLIWTSPLHPFLIHPDTVFIDNGLNTRDQPHVYRVEILGDGGNDVIGSSNVASSVFIGTVPNDEQLEIVWSLNTPWVNSNYDVYRLDDGEWVLIGSSSTGSYVDTGLVNGEEYCYHVISTGAYSDPDITAPLINWSQEVCGVPVDLTPPCVPELSLDNDCEEPLNTLTWTNPNEVCGDDDTWYYNVWFTPVAQGTPELIGTVVGAANTFFTHADGFSVAGCYAISAVDSVGNESALSTLACGDNCPEYTLPNVFTPNGDGQNDLLVPFPYRGVKEIDLQVFNRWGQLVFATTDPDIKWTGTHKDKGEPLPDGVYYYVCTVIFKRLAGDEPMMLKGYVHILGSGGQQRFN